MHQGALTRARNAGDTYQETERNGHVDVLEVILRRPKHTDGVPMMHRPAPLRHGDHALPGEILASERTFGVQDTRRRTEIDHLATVLASAYSATKAALRSLARTAAAELAERGIRVNTVAPGPIETPIFERTGMPKEALDNFIKDVLGKIPLKRIGQPEEVAGAVAFLASSDASYITGVELNVDGGMGQI